MMAEQHAGEGRGQWGSRAGFILAASGSAVGLGNIWKFPYITGENGGGIFVLIYLVCILLVGIPIMMAEIMIGRAAQKQPVAAFHTLQGKRTGWAGIGWLGVVAGFIILSYYIVVAGWAMDYTIKSAANFTGPIEDAAEVAGVEHRTSTTLAEMQETLGKRHAEKSKDRKDAVSAIRAELKPSYWDAHELYEAGLASGGAEDLEQIKSRQEAWRDADAVVLEFVANLVHRVEEANAEAEAAEKDKPADVLKLAGLSALQAEPPAEDVVQKYNEVRAVLFEREDDDFSQKVIAAQELTSRLEAETRKALEEARAHYAQLAAENPAAVRTEAEDLVRREHIFEKVQATFLAVAQDGWMSSFWMVIFMMITVIIVSRGVSKGIERACKLLMPTLLILILVMVVYGVFQPGFGEAISFVFKPDLEKLEASGVLEALGHAFFTLSLGMGAMITYGSYQKSKGGLASQSVTIAGLDTAIALLACLMIFPIIFTYDQDASKGPGLVFMSMPLAFAEMGSGGMLLSIMFFGLLVFAALTSAISLLEVVVSYFIDERGWSRRRAAWTMGGCILAFGMLSAFAADPDFSLSGWKASYNNTDFFTTMDYLASNWMLPLGGLFISIYAGWVMPKKLRNAEVEGLAPALFMGWLISVRFIAPALVIVVLLQKVGILDADELLHGLFH